MNRTDLRRDIWLVVGIYFLWTVAGIATFYLDNFIAGDAAVASTPSGHLHKYQWFELFKELSPVVVLLPAAWIGYSFQRRISFVNDLRVFWPGLVDAVQRSIEYLRRTEGDQAEFERTLTALRSRIDDARALFRRKNPSETSTGKYPYEGITKIHDLFQGLGFSEQMPDEETKRVRGEIVDAWQKVRRQILHEFDRADVD